MAVAAIDATVSGAASNSYATQAEALAYFEIRPDGKKFIDLNQDEQRGALLFATIMIERETYYAQRTDAAQALKFPFDGETVIPVDVKHAEFEQALHLVNGGYLIQQKFIAAQSSGVREMAVGETRTRMIPTHTDGFASFQLAPQVRQLLSNYVETGARLGRA